MTDYNRIEKAIKYIEANAKNQPSLEEIAGHIGLSQFHFQRLFKDWTGLTPKKFLQYITVEHAKELLSKSTSVLDASYEVGLSGPGRLHDLFITVDGITPGEFKKLGSGLVIRYGYHETIFGECLIAETERGICWLSFDFEGEDGLESLIKCWAGAKFVRDDSAGQIAADNMNMGSGEKLKLFVKGTNFQLKVWEALMRIPEGKLVSYGELADAVGCKGGSRAVGSAVGSNIVSYLIPCHRVLRASGEIGGYRWGIQRKKMIIAHESSNL